MLPNWLQISVGVVIIITAFLCTAFYVYIITKDIYKDYKKGKENQL